MFAMVTRTLHRGAVILILGGLGACAMGPPKTDAQKQADDSMADRVEQALAADKDLYSRHITVRADDGVIRLSGLVWDPPDLVQAERIAGGVPGVTRVVNSLELERAGQGNSPVTR